MDEAERQEKIAREAAEWLALLNSRAVSTEELNAFYEWRRDPENAGAYARGEQLWHDSRALGDDREIAEAVRQALERPRLDVKSSRPRLVGRRRLLLGASAMLAGLAGWFLLPQPVTYSTAIGEQLSVRLEDGSLMRLNTNSEARVSYSSAGRSVEVTSGQAYFEVQRDPQRPFHVAFDGADVVALGTRFDVSAVEGAPPRVVLVEGSIRVEANDGAWQNTLSAPGTALYLTSSNRPQSTTVDVEAVTSWTAGRLIFRQTPLERAIAEMNRYSRTPIVLQAPELRTVEVDGVFATGDPQAFVAAVTALFPLRAQVSRERIVLGRP